MKNAKKSKKNAKNKCKIGLFPTEAAKSKINAKK